MLCFHSIPKVVEIILSDGRIGDRIYGGRSTEYMHTQCRIGIHCKRVNEHPPSRIQSLTRCEPVQTKADHITTLHVNCNRCFPAHYIVSSVSRSNSVLYRYTLLVLSGVRGYILAVLGSLGIPSACPFSSSLLHLATGNNRDLILGDDVHTPIHCPCKCLSGLHLSLLVGGTAVCSHSYRG